MTAQPRWQTFLFAAAVGVAIVVASTQSFALSLQIFVLATLTAILGLPHGALDLPIAETLWPLHGWRGKARFAVYYIGLAAIVVALWLVVPALALVAFLAYSALHFAGDWQGAPVLLRWTGGLSAVGAPALVHHAEVANLFSYLAPAPAAALAATGLAGLGAVTLAALLGSVLFVRSHRERAAVEQGVLWVAALTLQPLVYFMVYFCALHSIRHFHSAINGVYGRRRAIMTAALLSAITVAGAALFSVYLSTAERVALDEAVFRVVFIGLAALTVPHMMLVDRFEQRVASPIQRSAQV